MYHCGVNMGGYLSQVKDNNFSGEHLENFITEDDFKRVKEWGFSIVRLPVDYMLFDPEAKGELDNEKIGYIERAFKSAEKHGLNVILDYHIAQGHTFSSKSRKKNDIWDKGSENRGRFLGTWDFFSKKFSKYKNVIFEIMNEPVADDDNDWNILAGEALGVIRKNAPDNYVVVESNRWGIPHTFPSLTVFDDPKIIYSFHCYEPILVTHQLAEWVPFVNKDIYVKKVSYPGRAEGIADVAEKIKNSDEAAFGEFLKGQDREYNRDFLCDTLKPVIEFRKKYNVPVLCGEFGCIAKAEPETRKNWLSDIISIFRENKISYTYWNYKNMDFGLFDYTEKYADNPNYSEKERLDERSLTVLKNGIL